MKAIISESQYKTIKENRELGEPLSTKTWRSSVIVYRALSEDVNEFRDKDYVTLSLEFAVDHAENNHVVYDTPHQVIAAKIKTSNLYLADNPGEYLYSGKTLPGSVVYKTKGYDYEGYYELTDEDFIGIRKI